MNLNTIAENLCYIKSRVSAQVCAVVKANAYGHGLITVSKFIESDADELAVATLEEANMLSTALIKKPIIILGAPDKSKKAVYYTKNIYPTVAETSDVDFLNSCGYCGAVNIKINTGMNRLGVTPENLSELLIRLKKYNIGVKSAFTHFFNSESLPDVSRQFNYFKNAVSVFGSDVPKLHVLASNCLFLPAYLQLDMVRTGIAMYGFGDTNLKPALSASTSILQIFSVKAGSNIGYGNCICERDCTLAAIRAGYGDGYRRIFNKIPRYVSINGHLAPVLGQVCMDIAMVDVSGLNISDKDRVNLIDEYATCDCLAASYGTINYEVLTSFSTRAERVYIGKNTTTQNFALSSIANYFAGR